MKQERHGELRADEGKLLHKIGTDVYRKRVLVTAAVTAEDWEEVDTEPPYTQGEYEAKVAQLVRQRYTADEEFALQRKAIWMQAHGQIDEAVRAEFSAYCDYVEECKGEARLILSELLALTEEAEESPRTEVLELLVESEGWEESETGSDDIESE